MVGRQMPEGRSEVGGGFADGLFGSKIFVPVLSKAGLAGFAELQEDSPCDNVLLEHFLALEMQKRGLLRDHLPRVCRTAVCERRSRQLLQGAELTKL